MSHRSTDPESRRLLVLALSEVIHADFTPCDGKGSAFCLGCVALRSIRDIQEVYEELGDDQEVTPPLVPPILPEETAVTFTIGELDEIAQRILSNTKDGDDGDTDLDVDSRVLS